jgi:hypothetical protein
MVYRTGDNNFGTAKWIVDSTAGQGTHTTIAAAITSAASGDTIFIRPGTYTENLTLKAGVNLAAYNGDQSTPNVTIVGKATMTTAGTVSIGNIRLQTNSDFLLAVTGTLASVVVLENCYLDMTNNTGISHTSSSASSIIRIKDCRGNLGTTGIAIFTSTSAGAMSLTYTAINNTGLSTTASSVSTGVIGSSFCSFDSAFSTSSVGLCSMFNTVISCNAINTTVLTTAGTGVSALHFSYIDSGTASAISVGSGTTVQFFNCEIWTSNTNAITGAGTFQYEAVSFSGPSALINPTTQSGGIIRGNQKVAPSAGFLGEQIVATVAGGASVALANGVAKSITSISCTPGVWDITGIVAFSTGGAVTSTEASVNTVTNTLGTDGDNSVWVNNPLVGTYGSTGVIPAWRQVFTATTTVYLVAFSAFATSVSAYGRISAVRVA